MMLELTVGINMLASDGGGGGCAIAALKFKYERPDAVINYVRRRGKRGDLRHPHRSIAARAE